MNKGKYEREREASMIRAWGLSRMGQLQLADPPPVAVKPKKRKKS